MSTSKGSSPLPWTLAHVPCLVMFPLKAGKTLISRKITFFIRFKCLLRFSCSSLADFYQYSRLTWVVAFCVISIMWVLFKSRRFLFSFFVCVCAENLMHAAYISLVRSWEMANYSKQWQLFSPRGRSVMKRAMKTV